MTNTIITGPSRSGTTLTCYLLNSLPDVVALDEPMNVGQLAATTNIKNHVTDFFNYNRDSIDNNRYAISKNINGKEIDNPYGDERDQDGYRKVHESVSYQTRIDITKSLDENYSICIKHPAAFTALLSELSAHFRCYAILRNPLAILASWNSIKIHANQGRAPAAERIDLELHKQLDKIEDRLDRQIHLLSWYFEKPYRYLNTSHILRYEDIISTNGRALSVISESANELNTPLENKNSNELYDYAKMHNFGERLLKSDGYFWNFYSKSDVTDILNKIS